MVVRKLNKLSENYQKLQGSCEELTTDYISMKKQSSALADVAQWFGCQLENQRVASSSTSQGTCLGCRPGPW